MPGTCPAWLGRLLPRLESMDMHERAMGPHWTESLVEGGALVVDGVQHFPLPATIATAQGHNVLFHAYIVPVVM